MEILKRVFKNVVPWYSEANETKKDTRNFRICDSANYAIGRAHMAVEEYQNSALFLINHGSNGRIKKG